MKARGKEGEVSQASFENFCGIDIAIIVVILYCVLLKRR